MDLNHGDFSSEPYCEVKNGGFIAYLVDSDDFDIEKPYSRVLIRRFDSKDGNKSIALVEDIIYGIEDQKFLEIVNGWIDKRQGKIELGEYHLSGMDYSDVYNTEDIFGLPEDISIDEILKNPNILFNFTEKVYLLKDNASYQIVEERMEKLSELLDIFPEYRIFYSEEEMNSFIEISNDNARKSKQRAIEVMAIYRAADHIAEGDFDAGEDYLSYLEDDEEEYNSFNEEKENNDGNIEIINIFDSSNPYYSYEKSILDMINGSKNRYDKIIINKHEYFDNISKFKPVFISAITRMAIKESRKNPNSLSSEALISARRMSESGLMKGVHLKLCSYNPDSASQELLFDLAKRNINKLKAKAQALSEKDDYDIIDLYYCLSDEEFKSIPNIMANSSNSDLKKYISENIVESLIYIIDSNISARKK